MRDDMKWLINMYVAHRGYHWHREVPENSIQSFEDAIKEGFAIELDLHITKDNKVIVFHDDTLERMTGVNKKVKDCTYDELKELRLFDTEQRIPLFSETLELVHGKVPLMVELKNKGKVGRLEAETYKLLKPYKGEYVIQSFNPYSVGWFKNNAPHIPRGQLSGSFDGEKLSVYKKVLLSNMLLNNVSKPDFINYEINYLHKLPAKYKKQSELPLLGWTARSEEKFIEAMKTCQNVVFEGFNPKYINGL